MDVADYIKRVEETNRFDKKDGLTPILFGLYGEVGGLLSITKKGEWREKKYTNAFDNNVKDEIGDIFWYLFCLAKRLDIDPKSISVLLNDKKPSSRNMSLMRLGGIAGEMLDEEALKKDKRNKIESFAKALSGVMLAFDIDWKSAMKSNMKKIESRFLPYDKASLPDFDKDFPENEQLPREFTIEFAKNGKGQMTMSWNGESIGDPLTDNSHDDDGYRFHDVFHFSYAAILHWSPVCRSLMDHKRKSKTKTDEVEDGGRAKVVEEGVSAWVFNIAKENNFFEDHSSLTFDLLKHVEQAVKGLEVVRCPLKLWEDAILKSYEIFRDVENNHGGKIIGDRKNRTISYQK